MAVPAEELPDKELQIQQANMRFTKGALQQLGGGAIAFTGVLLAPGLVAVPVVAVGGYNFLRGAYKALCASLEETVLRGEGF